MKATRTPQIDLHGFTGEQVEDAIDRFLLEQSRAGSVKVQIMTGKGQGVVQKIVIEYLKRAGYSWQYFKNENGAVNQGVLVVGLK
jgi:DNA-nicking Smr family endonuclease